MKTCTHIPENIQYPFVKDRNQHKSQLIKEPLAWHLYGYWALCKFLIIVNTTKKHALIRPSRPLMSSHHQMMSKFKSIARKPWRLTRTHRWHASTKVSQNEHEQFSVTLTPVVSMHANEHHMHKLEVEPFTVWSGPGPHLAQIWLGAGRCIYICNLDQTWTASLRSSSLKMHHLSAVLPHHGSVFQTADNVLWNASHTQPYSEAKLNVDRISTRMAKCKSSILCSALNVVASVNGPYI